MKKLFLFILLLTIGTANASDVFTISKAKTDLSKALDSYYLIDLNQGSLDSIIRNKPYHLTITVPGINKIVELTNWNPIDDEFNVILGSGKDYSAEKSIQYKGTIKGEKKTIVSFSFSSEGVMALICNDEGNFVIARLNSGEYVVYNDHNLKKKNEWSCDSDTQSDTVSIQPSELVSGLTTKCVKWYYETDYDLFVNKGSVAAVNSYIQGIFGQVATLYANDGMSIKLQTLFIWDVVDPYTGTTTTNYLSQFGTYRTSFNGDLAHLIGTQGGGGVAYVNTLCSTNTSNKMGYSAINTTYQNVPTYSWTVEVITHESGHNVASKHTHDCAWNGNNTPIDGCGPTAGYTTSCAIGPLPTNGGTIMSYCHLISSVGINFNNGFGPQPAALMVNTINTKACLLSCDSTGTGGGGGTGCTVPSAPTAISGNTNPCVGVTGLYSVPTVTGATSYTWQLPSGWSFQTGTTTNTNSVSITAGSGSGNIAAFAVNTCGSSSPTTLYVSPQTAPAMPSSITGPISVCSGQQGVGYSIAPVSTATSYTWTAPSGSTIVGASGNTLTTPSTSISVNFGSRKGKISVKANNVCSSSAIKSINITFSCRLAQDGIANIYTIQGKFLMKWDVNSLDNIDLPNGIYLVEFNSVTNKLIISR